MTPTELRLPQDFDAEQALVSTCAAPGACGGTRLDDLVLATSGEIFVSRPHRHVWNALQSLVGSAQEVNSISLKARLEEQGTLGEVGGFPGLMELLDGEEVGHPEGLVDHLQDLLARRRLMGAASKILRDASDASVPAQEMLEEIQAAAGLARPSSILARTPFGEFLDGTPPPVSWTVSGLIQRGAFGVIASMPNAGKSFICLMMLVSVATGKPFLGYPNENPPQGAVYLSLEDPPQVVHRRLQSIVDLFKAAGEWSDQDEENLRTHALLLTPNWEFNGATTFLPRLIPFIEASIAQMGVPVALLILDTFAQASDGDENSAKDVKPVISACYRLAARNEMTVLVTHHVAKGQTGRAGDKRTLDELMSPEWMRGTSAILGAARFVLQLVPLRPDQVEKNPELDPDKARLGGYCVFGVSKQSIGPRPEFRVLEQVNPGEPGAGCWTVHPQSLEILASLKGRRATEDLSKLDALLLALSEAHLSGVEPSKEDLQKRFCITARNPAHALRLMIYKLRNLGLVQKGNLSLTVSGYQRVHSFGVGNGCGDGNE